jgi:MATE family multidrug resistance protein
MQVQEPPGAAVKRATIRAEIRSLLMIAVPNALTATFRQFLDLENTAVIGRLKGPTGGSTALYIDSAALAALWINLTGASFGRGCDGALSVLAAQAYGAGNPHLVGVWLIVGLAGFSACALVLGGLWSATPQILAVAMPNDPAAVDMASRYALLAIPSAFPNMWMWCLACWLVAQRLAWPELIVYMLGIGLNLGLNLAFVFGLRLGFDGAPLAMDVTRLVSFLSLLMLTVLLHWRGVVRLPRLSSACREARRGRRLRSFAEQALPQLLMALLQELGIAAVAFLAVRMSEEAFSAHTIVMQSLLWLTSPLFGMMTATEVRIGNHLGAGDAAGARLVASLSLVMMMVLATPVSLALILLKDQLGHLFTDDANVVHYMAQVLPIVGGVYLVMGVFFAAMATLSGQGRPLPCALGFLLGAFLLSPTLGYVFAFVQTPFSRCPLNCDASPLVGLWWGFCAGYLVTVVIVCVAVWRSDWAALAQAAQERSEVPTVSCAPLGDDADADPAVAEAARATAMREPLIFSGEARGVTIVD